MMGTSDVSGLAVLPCIVFLRPSVGRVSDDEGNDPVAELARETTVSVEQIALEESFCGALPEGRNGVCDHALLFQSSVLGTPPKVINPTSRHFTHAYCRWPHCAKCVEEGKK